VSDRSKRNEIFNSVKNEHPNIDTRDVMADDFGWEVPVESVPIPSQGVIYPEGSPLYCQQKVDIKAMTAREEDILTSRALIQRGKVLTELMRSCLIDKSIDPDDMLAGDRNALMVSIRITGYGTDYKAAVDCPMCSAKNNNTFNLANLEIKRLTTNPVAPGVNLFEFKLPVTKKTVRFKLLTARDQNEIEVTEDRRKKMFPNDLVGSTVTGRLLTSIVDIDGVTDKNKITKFIYNMPALDSRKLRKFMEDVEPGIDMNLWMKCTSCGEDSRVGLPITTEFFWPRE